MSFSAYLSFFNAEVHYCSFVISKQTYVFVIRLSYFEVRHGMPVAAEFACERIVEVADRSYLLAAEVDIRTENIVFAPTCVVIADILELLRRGDFGEELPFGRIACAEIVDCDICCRS